MSDVVHWIVAVAAVVTAVGVIWRKAIRPVIHGVKRIDAGVQYIETELKYNGGSTARDAIARLEASSVRNEAAQARTARRLARIESHLGIEQEG